MIYTIKVATFPAQASYFVVGMPGDSKIAGFWVVTTNWRAAILKDVNGATRPRAFIGLKDGDSLPVLAFQYEAVPVGSAIEGASAPRVLLELVPKTFSLGSAMTQAEANDLSLTLGFTIPQVFWDSSKWLATL